MSTVKKNPFPPFSSAVSRKNPISSVRRIKTEQTKSPPPRLETMIDATHNSKMYLKASLGVGLGLLVLCCAANYTCSDEAASPGYIQRFSLSLIVFVSIAFLLLNALEWLKASPDDPRRIQSCLLMATLSCNTFALTQITFSEDSTLVVVLSVLALLTLIATLFAITTSPDEELSGETKETEENEYALVVDAEMQ